MKTVPKHIGIIMDGNRRWAKQRNLEAKDGHKAGMEALSKTIEACADRGVEVVTVYAFSTENFKKRSPFPPRFTEKQALVVFLKKIRVREDTSLYHVLSALRVQAIDLYPDILPFENERPRPVRVASIFACGPGALQLLGGEAYFVPAFNKIGMSQSHTMGY